MFAGLRIGEALALQWKDIDFNNKIIHVNAAISVMIKLDNEGNEIEKKSVVSHTKTMCSKRSVPMLDILYDELKSWNDYQKSRNTRRRDFTNPEMPVFSIEKGHYPKYTEIKTKLKAFIKRCSLEEMKLNFHKLRHTYSTILFENNINPAVIQCLLGHQKVTTTLMFYNSVNITGMKKSVEKLNQRMYQDCHKILFKNKNENEAKRNTILQNMTDEEFDNLFNELVREKYFRQTGEC